jgi:hypothetical protein
MIYQSDKAMLIQTRHHLAAKFIPLGRVDAAETREVESLEHELQLL